jgi:hypothetical protein
MPMNTQEYGIEIIGGYDWSYDRLAIVICDRSPNGDKLAKPLIFEECKEGLLKEPTFNLRRAEAQQLFNLLWREGYRPADGTGNTGHTQALSNHLEDMRRLVFKGETK